MAYSAFLPSALWREVYLSVTAPSLAECTPMQLVQGLRALASLGVQPGWEWMGLWFEASAPLLHTCSTNLCSQVRGGVRREWEEEWLTFSQLAVCRPSVYLSPS